LNIIIIIFINFINIIISGNIIFINIFNTIIIILLFLLILLLLIYNEFENIMNIEEKLTKEKDYENIFKDFI